MLGFTTGKKMEEELCAFVADRLTHYKQPREVHFVEVVPEDSFRKDSAPRTASADSMTCM